MKKKKSKKKTIAPVGGKKGGRWVDTKSKETYYFSGNTWPQWGGGGRVHNREKAEKGRRGILFLGGKFSTLQTEGRTYKERKILGKTLSPNKRGPARGGTNTKRAFLKKTLLVGKKRLLEGRRERPGVTPLSRREMNGPGGGKTKRWRGGKAEGEGTGLRKSRSQGK